jgi:branched-subunit amino acid transport protein
MTDLFEIPGQGKTRSAGEGSNWIGSVLNHAQQLTKSWGRYLAFVAVITIIAIVALSIPRSDAGLMVLGVVVAALVASLLAGVFKLYD